MVKLLIIQNEDIGLWLGDTPARQVFLINLLLTN